MSDGGGRMARVVAFLRTPPAIAGLLALVVRAVTAAAQWRLNPVVRRPELDGEYYLEWAQRIAAGDILGSGPAGVGEPYFLNPLYAWLISPLALVWENDAAPVIALQVLLGAGTAALTADAARRHAGNAAAWTAGLAVAFSAALVHLDTHVSVSGLAAFLVAGAVWSCAPGNRGHGPVAAGLWLGLGALARPVTAPALPFVAWLQARRNPPRWRGAAVVLAVFGAFACASFLRNVTVSGEPVLFTAANGHNLHLGNNPVARRTDSMLSYEFRFRPKIMHEDSRFRVAYDIGREPTRAEVSGWYARAAWRELADAPGASIAHYANKLRWFFSWREPPSSADLAHDRRVVPWLWMALLPSGLLAAAAAGGLLLARGDRDLLLGAGSLALAHVAACTMTFPLSHYRSPAVPALAVLAAVGVARVLAASGSARRRLLLTGGGTALLLTIVGAWVPPQPETLESMRLTNVAVAQTAAGDFATAEATARASLEMDPASPAAVEALLRSLFQQRRYDAARDWAARGVELQPWSVSIRSSLARLDLILGHADDARAGAEALVADFPWSAAAHGERGVLRAHTGDIDGARGDLQFALDRGYLPDAQALEMCGLRAPERR